MVEYLMQPDMCDVGRLGHLDTQLFQEGAAVLENTILAFKTGAALHELHAIVFSPCLQLLVLLLPFLVLGLENVKLCVQAREALGKSEALFIRPPASLLELLISLDEHVELLLHLLMADAVHAAGALRKQSSLLDEHSLDSVKRLNTAQKLLA